MNILDEQDKSELRDCILNLAATCPVEGCNAADCPLFAIRKLTPARRRKWLNTLTAEELDFLCAYHHVCMNIKLAAYAATPCV
jgi:hypothetical protein